MTFTEIKPKIKTLEKIKNQILHQIWQELF